MLNSFVKAVTVEWMKKRGSLSDWLVITGGFFVPHNSIDIYF